MAFERLSRLKNIFKDHGKLDPEKPKTAIGPQKDASNPEDQRQPHQASTSDVEPVRAAFLAPESTASTPLPASQAIRSCPTPPQESEHAAQSLWDRAYDRLRESDRGLVDKYEKLLSLELSSTTMPPSDTPVQTIDQAKDVLEQTNNRIDGANPQNRQQQLKTIISRGLQRIDELKTKYVIFGHEFVPRDQIAQAARFVTSIKKLIDETVKVSQEASLAWAGVCIILPILTNPVAAEEANRDGFAYVTSRIRFYVELEHLLWPASRGAVARLKEMLKDDLITLYQHILEFQVKTVLRCYEKRLTRLGKDTFKSEIWKDMLSKIQKLEKTCHEDFLKINDSATRMELEELNKKADSFLNDMSSILSVVMENHGKPSSSSYNNYDSGNQFNITGGAQNNNTSSGNQFPGATFHATVHFSGRSS
ncbi:hypothetical protein QQS21_000234 [Conoideocrella luteorostrata]|uniref:NWD NACHT-NTPase N-terminal domain-containing protein n=1 Tax=Conoideocrella luteorostrata TaxID=1105319 RepID=A0AAJ0D197_9HYPO|nr:hypothetical protein QQS21_000234 [Conoideocrella luteorostrata]